MDIRPNIAALETSVAREIDAMKASLIKWYIGTALGTVCLVVGLVKFAPW